jgi:hypothetical protein
VATVKSADDMDAETFLKHINARHVPIGKMTHFGKSSIPHDEDEHLLRAYHDRLHRAGPIDSAYSNETPINHNHAAPKGA